MIDKIQPYVDVMMQATGLEQEAASVCVYYALATYFISDFQKFPTLVFLGPAGTGKTAATEQMYQLCCDAKFICGRTPATIRDELSETPTAILDEADYISCLEDILTRRYSRTNSTQTINKASEVGYTKAKQDLFGATVLCCRKPFRDVAMRTRSIIIRTKSKPGHYKIKENCSLRKIAKKVELIPIETSQRMMDTWKPLISVAETLHDKAWTEWAYTEVVKESTQMGLAQEMEPSICLVYAFKALWNEKRTLRVSDVRHLLRDEFDTKLSVFQVLDLCQGMNVQVIKPQGYLQIKLNQEQLQGLLADVKPLEPVPLLQLL